MTLAALVITASAAPRVALVRVKDIYSGLPSTAALQEQIQAERQELMKNQRAVDLRRIIGELRTLQARLSDKDHPLDEATTQYLLNDKSPSRSSALWQLVQYLRKMGAICFE